MIANDRKTIAVVGASGQQGGAVVRALQADGRFKVRALTRDPARHPDLAEEVTAADLDHPDSLKTAFDGAYGVFLVTDAWGGADELKQVESAVRAANDSGIRHFVWSTLPDVEAISGGKLHVPHFTNKAKADRIVKDAAFAHSTYVIAPFFYQNLTGAMAPQELEDGNRGWALPIDPEVRAIHMGDITELGPIVAGAFAHPDQAGHGEYLPLVGDFMSFNDIVDTLNRQGHDLLYRQVAREAYATFYPGAAEIAEMFAYFEAHTYLGRDVSEEVGLANTVAGQTPTSFADWAKANLVLAPA